MSKIAEQALSAWGLEGASYRFVAGRENQVYRVASTSGDLALRLKRPGYRTDDELRSELAWLVALESAGLTVPQPVESPAGNLLEVVSDRRADMLTWLPGRILGSASDGPRTFGRLGETVARLHAACDALSLPDGFERCAWDMEGLLGEAPIWGRFWENPSLSPEERRLLVRFREAAFRALEMHGTGLDFGLIHADLVWENVLVEGEDLALIDFDDGGFGFRMFDLATTVLKLRGHPGGKKLEEALLNGYRRHRDLQIETLNLFVALRSTTYVGWIVPRLQEPGAVERNARFIAAACRHCTAFLEGENAV